MIAVSSAKGDQVVFTLLLRGTNQILKFSPFITAHNGMNQIVALDKQPTFEPRQIQRLQSRRNAAENIHLIWLLSTYL